MKKSKFTRRNFNRLSAAAFGGMMTGAVIGCQQPADTGGESPPPDSGEEDGSETASAGDKHICRGLNACKGQGPSGSNECAGTGQCATAAAHACGGQNECKGQGGCGENPGENACKGEGKCHVPLPDDKWEKARKAFEEKMEAAGKQVGDAPSPA